MGGGVEMLMLPHDRDTGDKHQTWWATGSYADLTFTYRLIIWSFILNMSELHQKELSCITFSPGSNLTNNINCGWKGHIQLHSGSHDQ